MTLKHERRNRTLTAAAVALGIAVAGQAPASVSAETALDPAQGAVLWRWIGVLDDGATACPPPPGELGPGWRGGPLFPEAELAQCPELGRFCVWEYDGGAGPVSPTDALCLDEIDGRYELGKEQRNVMLCRLPAVADAEPDAMVLAPAGGALHAKLWPELEKRFWEQAGRTALPAHPGTAPEVWLTLLDTSPQTPHPTLADSSPHGESLAHFARSLVCDPGSGTGCVADVRTRLALAYKSFDRDDPNASVRDPVQGGFFGLLSELAETVVTELVDWRNTGADRLVLNLSVAWDRLYGGATPVETMPPAVLAVYRALECAACLDVVTVAAAGNLADLHAGNDFRAPMLPAAWTKRATAPAPGCDRPRPLLYAAGGFDARRRPLANALEDGIPELVAYGDHAAIGTGLTRPTATLTGSSTATLVVSATAAAVAYYAPASPVADVMATVYAAGEPISGPADFCTVSAGGADPQTCPSSRYVSLCESVHLAYTGSSLLAPCAPRPSRRPDLSGLSPVPAGAPTLDVGVACRSCWQDPRPCWTLCGADLPLFSLASSGFDFCPRRRLHALARKPGAHPQPQSNLCPDCIYDDPSAKTGGAGATFYGEIEATAGEELQNPILHLRCGKKQRNYHLSTLSPLRAGDTFVVEGLPKGCEDAMLTYTVHPFPATGPPLGSSTVPILVATGSS